MQLPHPLSSLGDVPKSVDFDPRSLLPERDGAMMGLIPAIAQA
jgi:hypothetical protein